MTSATRVCPSCVAALPSDAVFCHKCGASTPMEIDGVTGEIHSPELSGLADEARRAKLQAAVGDSCEIRRLLGRGGFAEVYVAYDKRLKREIAVKTIRGDLVVNDMLLERFQREAEAVAKLRHPNVVPIYAVGEADGLAYFTMPLIEGQSLAEVLEHEGRVSVEESCRILREAANALHAAHRMGLVHRDIKPENVMLEGPERSAIVMDFGIAKTEGPDAKGLTGTGMLVGTPQYMSPEQAVGERTLDARSDQYSLAMVGYRMLTGQLPFEADSIQTLIYKTVTSVPAPAYDISPEVPKAVSDILAKALSKRPEDRYESMAAFAAAIASADGGGTSTRAPSGGWRAAGPDMATRVKLAMRSMPTWRHPLVWLAVVSMVVGLLLDSRSRSTIGMTIAANRSEAVFAAKAFLRDRGIPVAGTADPSLDTRKASLEFLNRTIGTDSTERRAAADVPVWRWSVKFGRANDSAWTVDVGPENRIVGFNHKLVDSAQGAAISHDSARMLAEREIVARGWSLAVVERVRDSTITRKHRVDHQFRWRKRADAIRWRGTDSAFVEIRAGVSGAAVTDYSLGLKVPDSYAAATDTGTASKVITGLGVTAAIVLVGFAFALGTTRQRVDELQWSTAGRLLGVAVLLLVPLVIPSVINSAVGGAGAILSFLIGCVFSAAIFAAVLFIAVVGESLAKERHPSAVQGLVELARGRSLPPEALTGTLWGYVFGGMIVGASALIQYAAAKVFHDPTVSGTVRDAFGLRWPSTYALLMLAGGIIASFMVLYAVALFSRWRVTSALALVLPALIFVAITIVTLHVGQSVVGGVQMVILAFVVWRYGYVAGVIAFWLPDVLTDGVAFLISGGSEFVTAGVITLTLALVPLVVAAVAYRRQTRTMSAVVLSLR